MNTLGRLRLVRAPKPQPLLAGPATRLAVAKDSAANQVLEVIPHAKRSHVANLLQKNSNDVQTTVTALLQRQHQGTMLSPVVDLVNLEQEDSKIPARSVAAETTIASPSIESKISCYCCYDDFPIAELCQCQDGHLICVDCLKGYAETQIFGMGKLGVKGKDDKKPIMQLQCFKDDCKMGFGRDFLLKALPPKTVDRYDELQAQISLDAAGLANLVKCPKCDFRAELDERTQVFSCQMESCRFQSCRKCGLDAAHVGKHSCEEAKQRLLASSGKHKVEEALTLAKLRNCPQCNRSFLKESGCNKMTCPNCGCLSCYLCRGKITREEGYRHFCQTPHCDHSSCGKCQLHSSDNDLKKKDVAEMRKAGLEAAGEDDGPGSGVVDQLMNHRPAKKTKTPTKKKRHRK